jgi:hypothetical protein
VQCELLAASRLAGDDVTEVLPTIGAADAENRMGDEKGVEEVRPSASCSGRSSAENESDIIGSRLEYATLLIPLL